MTNRRNRAASRKTKCKKVRYRDQEEAKDAITTIKLFSDQPDRIVKPVRAYHCPDCKGWHLTHLTS